MRPGKDRDEKKLAERESENLAEYTLEGKWEEVIEIYKKSEGAHTTIIDESIGTALHVAVHLDEEDIVDRLVHEIVTHPLGSAKIKALEMEDEHGDTPLHVAASRGFARICQKIIGEEKERKYLLSRKNKYGETPLFLAAINWQKQAFAYLSKVLENNVALQDLVRDNGDTILHCAIQREYFDLAVIIVQQYDFLGTHKNKEGFTPLRVLATRPTAFKSASYFSWWKRILYHCILVEPLHPERTTQLNLRKMNKRPKSDEEDKYPKNYSTLYDFFAATFSVVKDKKQHDAEDPSNKRQIQIGFLPPNYRTFHDFVKSAYMHILGLSGVELKEVKKIKKRHQWSGQLLEALMKRPRDMEVDQHNNNVYSQWKQGETSRSERSEKDEGTDDKTQARSQSDTKEETKPDEEKKIDEKETTFLVAARNGIVEMVNEILTRIPSAIHDTNIKKENVLLVAVLNRQPLVESLKMRLLESKPGVWNNLILALNKDEKTMLHLAANAPSEDKSWQIAGSALHMMWDIKWFQYIKSLVPKRFYFRSDNNGKTAGEIFKETHKDLIEESSKWLKETSASCSVVAGLVAGVSFAAASAIPGGTNDEGKPILEGNPAFDVFAISSLVGLCFSVTGLIMFLTILTNRKEARDFRRDLPLKLLLGLSSLFVSIATMFISFCTGHFFLLTNKYRMVLFPIYIATTLPVTFYAVSQFPLYFDLLTAILIKVPRASDKGDNL